MKSDFALVRITVNQNQRDGADGEKNRRVFRIVCGAFSVLNLDSTEYISDKLLS